MYTLDERINNLFFGILLLGAQLDQNSLLQEDLERDYIDVESYHEYGMANGADLDAVKAEILKTKNILV